jgi:hypothetical protein
MGRRAKNDSSALVRAAKHLVDHDDDRPLTREEAKVMAQTRRELSRPSKEEIEKMAAKLLRRN